MSGRVPDLHVDLLLVEHGLVLVDLGHLGRVVEDEAPGHVPHDQRWNEDSRDGGYSLIDINASPNTRTP